MNKQEVIEKAIKKYCLEKYGDGYYPDVRLAIIFGANWYKEQCVQICDEFTVGFDKWKFLNCFYSGNDVKTYEHKWYFKSDSEYQKEYPETYTTTELLEIYKHGL